MRARPLLILLGVVLLAVTSMVDAKGTVALLEHVPLKWTPKEKLKLDKDKMSLPAEPIQIEAFQDAREDREAIGENLEESKPKPVTTTDDVGAFVSSHLREVLTSAGLKTVDGGGAVTIRGRVTQFFVKETHTYKSEVTVHLTVVGRDGSTLWNGSLSGQASHFGRSYKSENYCEALSDAVVGVASAMLQTADLRGALSGRIATAAEPRLTLPVKPPAVEAPVARSRDRQKPSAKPPAEETPVTRSRGRPPAAPPVEEAPPAVVQEPPAPPVMSPIVEIPATGGGVVVRCTPKVADASRVALVIGNQRYSNDLWSSLRNPVNDARAMSQRLCELGFDVRRYQNVTEDGFDAALRDFGARIQQRSNPVAFLFFSGHGSRGPAVGDERELDNYLIPVDSHARYREELPRHAVALERDVISQMRSAMHGDGTGIVVLDACRDNKLPTRTRDGGKGLAEISAQQDFIVAFATRANDVAQDGRGELSPYTQSLARLLGQTPDEDVTVTFKRVTQEVREQTGGRQQPEAVDLSGRLIVLGRPGSAAAGAAVGADRRTLPPVVRGQAPGSEQWSPSVSSSGTEPGCSWALQASDYLRVVWAWEKRDTLVFYVVAATSRPPPLALRIAGQELALAVDEDKDYVVGPPEGKGMNISGGFWSRLKDAGRVELVVQGGPDKGKSYVIPITPLTQLCRSPSLARFGG
jgi:hypothetical protein